jgi:dipeptidyl-peptidase 4
MGTPQDNADGYNISSVLPQLASLTPPLQTSYLLVHGTGDDNVHFSNSAEIMKALVLQQVMFDVMVYPNQDHSISRDGAGQHVWRKIGGYLLQNL